MSTQQATNYRWVVVALVTIITIINYLDRSAIAYAIHPIQSEFGFNNTQFGLIGSAFAVGYICMTFAGGILVDRFGSHALWTIAAIVWSLSLMLLSQAQSMATFIIFRILLGIGEGAHFPLMTRTLANWLPMQERGRAFSMDLVGVPLASMIGAPLISTMVYAMGWKVAFLILGALGIVWAAIWFIAFKNNPKESQWVNAKEQSLINKEKNENNQFTPTTLCWKSLIFNPSLLSNNIAFFSFGYLVFFAITWLPGYLEREYSLGLKQTGLWLILPWMAASIFMIIGGILSDKIWQRTGSLRKSRSHLIWASQLLSALSFLLLFLYHDIYWAIGCISLGTGLAFFPNAPFLSLNADLSHEHAGKSQGVMSTFFAVSGLLSPFVTGLLTDLTGTFEVAIFVMIGLSLLSSMGVLIFQFPDKENDKKVKGTERTERTQRSKDIKVLG